MYCLRSLADHPNCLFKYFQSFIHGLFGNCERRTNLDGCTAKTERREKQETSNKTLIGNFCRHIPVGFGGSRFYDMNPGNQTFTMDGSNNIMIQFQSRQSGVKGPSNGFRFLNKTLLINNV
jgi:hypothetical protein